MTLGFSVDPELDKIRTFFNINVQIQVVTNLQKMSLSSLLLPMEAADLVCMAQMGRQEAGKIRGMIILEEIIEKRNVKLYKKNVEKLQKKLETWKTNLERDHLAFLQRNVSKRVLQAGLEVPSEHLPDPGTTGDL